MRTLYLLRHAKASSQDPGSRDFERTLEKQGREAAARTGKVLTGEKLSDPLFLSSTSTRTRETTEIVLMNGVVNTQVRFDSRIYDAELRTLLTALRETDDARSVVVLVGHNPGMEALLRFLTGEVRPMPTAGLAKVALKSLSWKQLNESDGDLEWLVIP
jgi:phosphohistidine phosphatase